MHDSSDGASILESDVLQASLRMCLDQECSTYRVCSKKEDQDEFKSERCVGRVVVLFCTNIHAIAEMHGMEDRYVLRIKGSELRS